MHLDDETRLRHMLDAAHKTQEFVSDKQRGDLANDSMLLHALLHCLEVVGEAAAHVSKERQSSLSAIPWPQVVAMRNRLIHGYFDVDIDRVWDTVTANVPPLISTLEAALSTTTSDGGSDTEAVSDTGPCED